MIQNEKNEIVVLPLLPLRGIVVFPYMMLHFDVGRPKSLKALEEAMSGDQTIFLVTQKDFDIDDPTIEDINKTGTIAKIKQVIKLPGEDVRVLIEGASRATINKVISDEEFFLCEVLEHNDEYEEMDLEIQALKRQVVNAFENYFAINSKMNPETLSNIMAIDNLSKLADVVAANITLPYPEKQKILECLDIRKRVEMLLSEVLYEIEVMKLERTISAKVKNQIDKNQREYYLREQLKVITDELGDSEGIGAEVEGYRQRIKEAKMNKEASQKAQKEAERLLKMSQNTPEATVIRNYLDCMLDLPWHKKSRERFDLKLAQQILDDEHYGLEKVKERIIEYLAVRKLSKSSKGPILCLVGPPGVGKTSIGKSIAHALNRKYVRVSLGGVRDEADIRGHRKTYIGSMPGRIINAMRSAGTVNPLILFDEIDKMASDFRGDPASAMLEVLDSEQNFAFRDHYLEVAYDLSNVLFITTANTTDTIPSALLDRMEVIDLSGYTQDEKLAIAERHLIPKQLEKHGIKSKQLIIDSDAVIDIINYYTREAGVRNLERQISNVCRKAAANIVAEKRRSITVTTSNLEAYLGKRKFHYELMAKKDEVGVARGLAWTRVGGDTMGVEVNVMEGSGKIELTGNLGDVMKESAKTAISYIRSRAGQLELPHDFHRKLDIHIHVPEGAVPKDGPSAGITMATALVSALTGFPVLHNVAMTGEITLRGRVLPIGGLKEKSLAAFRAGIKTVIIPEENKPDLEDIAIDIRNQMKFVLASDMDKVLKTALSTKKQSQNLFKVSEINAYTEEKGDSDVAHIPQ